MLGRELLFLSALALASASPAQLDTLETRADASEACQQIASKISPASDVLYVNSLSPNFTSDTHHWFDSSSQTPICVLEAGSADDVSAAMKIIGTQKVPFAAKSGGHASQPGFSSTTGVHINFNRMMQVNLSPDKSTVEIGMGNTWFDVYKALDGTGVNVVGGRTQGPGVGGFTLGGGFSWKTNQFGLTCDNVKSFNLILPSGQQQTVDASSKDLFFALKGGLNRFGVATSAVYYTHPQSPQVFAGIRLYGPGQTQKVLDATQQFFVQNKDPKAQVITTLSGSATGTSILALFFYDGPTEPTAFKLFDGIPSLVSTVKASSFKDFVAGIPAQIQTNARGTFNTVSTTALTPGFIAAIKNQTDYFGKQMLAHGATTVSYDVEPFDTSYGQYATDSAYPHADSPLPLNLYFAWLDASQDAYWYQQMKDSVALLKAEAQKEGIYKDDFTAYPNYAISGTSADVLYGANAARLRAVKKQVDPSNIMGLAGGFDLS